ncbi:hypothetical protein K439DRAFT_945885 [Ramaria rubella]|nr:hypothetical protein K439DRAFT_945885 [Ramaria rubella]
MRFSVAAVLAAVPAFVAAANFTVTVGSNSLLTFDPPSVNASSPGMPTFLLNVTQDTPIWFYCAQTNPVNHCHSGMVGAINPTPEKTFAAFQVAMGNATSNSTTSNSTTPASSTAGSSTSTSGAPSASNTSAPSTKPSGAGRVVSSGATILTLGWSPTVFACEFH